MSFKAIGGLNLQLEPLSMSHVVKKVEAFVELALILLNAQLLYSTTVPSHHDPCAHAAWRGDK